jgi:hypothetical protein
MNDLVVLGKIAEWEKLKALVLDSVSSPITKRVYNMALNEFMAWFQQAPRPGFRIPTSLTTGSRIRPLSIWSPITTPISRSPTLNHPCK